jgi:hypothetical protein
MKNMNKIIIGVILLGMIACNTQKEDKPSDSKKSEKATVATSKYKSMMPDGYFINNRKMETRLGELEFKNGFPTESTTKKLFEYRTFYRAVEAFTQNTFAASLYAMRKGYEDMGAGKSNQVLVWENRMDNKSLFLTANSETVYAMTFLDLKVDGPTVIECPPNVLGLLDDMWMHYVGDMGLMGPDKGKGGKFLIIPPGYDGNIPSGYHVMHSKTYGVWVAIRGFLVDGKTDVAMDNYRKYLKVYSLAQKDNPTPTELINASGKPMNTIHPESYAMLEELGKLVEEEHPDALEDGSKFLLASIGMEFGKPFKPNPEMKKLLEEAGDVGAAMNRTNMWEFTDRAKYIYDDRQYWNPFVGGAYRFDNNGYIDFDAQSFFAAYATGVTPAMATKKVGFGSQYLCGHKDKNGNNFDGAKTYKLNVPKDIPAQKFWSVVLYSSDSRSMIEAGQPMPSVGTYSGVETNADGSVDLYFGPEAPKGKEKNWIETVPGKGWTIIFRLYGPLQPFFDQTWKLNDVVLLNDGDQ